MSPVRDWLAGYTPDWRTRARTGQLTPPPEEEDELGLLGGRAETLEHTFMEGERRNQFRSEMPDPSLAPQPVLSPERMAAHERAMGGKTLRQPRDWLAGYTPDWREREAAERMEQLRDRSSEEDRWMPRGQRSAGRAESIGPATPMIPAEEAARMDESRLPFLRSLVPGYGRESDVAGRNIPESFTRGSKYPRLSGTKAMWGDMLGTLAGGTVKVAARALPGDYEEQMAAPEPSLAQRIGNVAERIYKGVDQAREERIPRSAIDPTTTFDRPKGMQAAEVVHGFTAEGSKYVYGGGLVRRGAAKAGGALLGTKAGQATMGWLRGLGGRPAAQTVLETTNRLTGTRAAQAVGQVAKPVGRFFKEPIKDVLAFLPVDYLTTQREVDSVAFMADMFLDPEKRKEWTDNPDNAFKNILANERVAGGLDLLHDMAGEAVKTSAGRTKFEAAFGFAADVFLRTTLKAVGKPAMAAFGAATTPSAVGRATEAGVGGFARELAGPEFVPSHKPSDLVKRGINDNQVVPGRDPERLAEEGMPREDIDRILGAETRQEAYDAGGLWGDEDFDQLLNLPHARAQARAQAKGWARPSTAAYPGVVEVFMPESPEVLSLAGLTGRNDVTRVTVDPMSGPNTWQIGEGGPLWDHHAANDIDRLKQLRETGVMDSNGRVRGRRVYVRADDVLMHGTWAEEGVGLGKHDMVVNKLRVYESEEAAWKAGHPTIEAKKVVDPVTRETRPPRYSRLEEVVKTERKKATGAEWLKQLEAHQGKGRFKLTEFRSTGLRALLQADPDKVFTRSEIMSHLEAHRLETPVFVRGPEKIETRVEEITTDAYDLEEMGDKAKWAVFDQHGDMLNRFETRAEADQYAARYLEAGSEYVEALDPRKRPRWEGHSRKEMGRNETRAPENYQEILIKYDTPTLRAHREAGVPYDMTDAVARAQDDVDRLLDERSAIIERMEAANRVRDTMPYDPDADPNALYDPADVARTETLDTELTEAIEVLRRYQETVNTRTELIDADAQRGPTKHGDEPGTVVRIRGHDRFILDPKTGKEIKILGVSEVQSDIHNTAHGEPGKPGVGYRELINPNLEVRPPELDARALPEGSNVEPPKRANPYVTHSPSFRTHAQERIGDPFSPEGAHPAYRENPHYPSWARDPSRQPVDSGLSQQGHENYTAAVREVVADIQWGGAGRADLGVDPTNVVGTSRALPEGAVIMDQSAAREAIELESLRIGGEVEAKLQEAHTILQDDVLQKVIDSHLRHLDETIPGGIQSPTRVAANVPPILPVGHISRNSRGAFLAADAYTGATSSIEDLDAVLNIMDGYAKALGESVKWGQEGSIEALRAIRNTITELNHRKRLTDASGDLPANQRVVIRIPRYVVSHIDDVKGGPVYHDLIDMSDKIGDGIKPNRPGWSLADGPDYLARRKSLEPGRWVEPEFRSDPEAVIFKRHKYDGIETVNQHDAGFGPGYLIVGGEDLDSVLDNFFKAAVEHPDYMWKASVPHQTADQLRFQEGAKTPGKLDAELMTDDVVRPDATATFYARGRTPEEAIGKVQVGLSRERPYMQSVVLEDAKPSQSLQDAGHWDPDQKRLWIPGDDPSLARAAAQETADKGAIPGDVPFRARQEQQETALKELIDMAIEGGYDGVSIITGRQSAAQYRVLQVASEMRLMDDKLTVLNKEGSPVRVQGYGRLRDKYLDPKDDHAALRSIVGNDIADKLIEAERLAKLDFPDGPNAFDNFPGIKVVEFNGQEYDLTGAGVGGRKVGLVADMDAEWERLQGEWTKADDIYTDTGAASDRLRANRINEDIATLEKEMAHNKRLLARAEAHNAGQGTISQSSMEVGGQGHISTYDEGWPLTVSKYAKEVGGIEAERIDYGFGMAERLTEDWAVIDKSLVDPSGKYYEDPVIARFATAKEAREFRASRTEVYDKAVREHELQRTELDFHQGTEALGELDRLAAGTDLDIAQVEFVDMSLDAGRGGDPNPGDLFIRITPEMRRKTRTEGQRIALRGPAGGAAGFAVGYALPAESPEERMTNALTGFQVGALGDIGVTLGRRSLKLKGMPSELRAGIRDVDNALAAKNPTKDLNQVARVRLGLKQQDLAHFGVDPKDTKGYAAFLRNQLQSTEAPRTPDIRGSYVRPEWMNASREKLKELVRAGAGRGDRARFWYEDGQKALVTLVPNEEFDQFVKFFATFSQNTDPRQNFFEALREWGKVQRGEPISGVLAGKKKKAKRVLAGEELDTPKIWSFAENLLGSGDHATIDLWIWRILDDTKPEKGAAAPGDKDGLRYAQAREELREIAAELTAETGDEWTPAQVQASMWVEYRDKWSVETGGQPLGNDSFLELMDETLRRVEALDPTTRVVSEMMPSPQAGRVVGIQEADVATRVAYSEERLGAARKYLTKLFRDLDIADEVGGALGVEGALARGVRTRAKEGTTVSVGGTWEGRWNSNLPFVLPRGIEPWKRDVVVAALGNIFEQDAVFYSTFRNNDQAALVAAKDAVDAPGLNGSNSGVQVVTRQHMDQATSDALARHLGETLEGVNFTQQGDALLFGDFSGGTPQQFWDRVQLALNSFEDGRFWDEIADLDDLTYTRYDGDLVGDTYGTGQQWEDLYNTARSQAPNSDEVLGRLAPDLLESHRDGLRTAYAKIDRKFKRRLAAKDKVNVEAQDPRPTDPSAPERLAGPDPTDPRLGAADPQVVSAIAKAGTGSLVGGFVDAQIGEDSPVEGFLIGAGVAVGPSIARVVKATRAATEVSDVAIDRALQQQVAAEVAGTAIEIPGAPLPKDVPPPRGPGADKIDPDEFVNIEKFGLDPKSTEKRLREEVQNVVDTHGMDPKVVVSHKQTIAMANSLGLDAEDIGKRLSGAAGAPAGAEMLAARNLISSNAKRIEALYKQLSDNGIHLQSDEAQPYIAQINALSAENHTLLSQYLPASSETGRALNAMKIAAQQTMDPATWTIRAAKVSGVTELPASVQAEIVRLTSAEDRAGLMKLLADLHQSDISEQVVALGKAAMLSAVPTHMMNLLSTAYNVFAVEHIKDLPASWIDHLISGWAGTDATKHWGSVGAQLEAAKKGAEQGIEGAKNVFSGRMLEGSLERWDQIRQTNIDLAQRTPILKHVPVLPQALDLAMDKFQKFVFGALGAGDASLTGFAVQRSLAEQARVIAKNEGLKGAALDARAADILANETTPEMMLEAIAQGELATFRNRGIVGQGVVGLKRGVRQLMKKSGGLVGAGDPAHTMTYLATEKIIPWSMTPSNVMTRVAEASPLGAMSVAFEPYFWKLLTRQVDKSTEIPAAQKRIVERLGRSTVGSAPILLGMYLYNQGLLSLGWTREKAGQRELTGEEENAWKIGDTWISMERMSPGGNLVILGGYIAAEMQDPEATTEGLTRAVEVATASGMSIARTAYEQSFLEGIRDLGDAVMATERRTGRENLLTGTASMFVPNILKRINRWVDPVARQRETVMDQLRQAIPGASRGLPARVDPFGQTVRRTQGFYASMVDPFQMSPDKALENPTRKLMQDLDINISRLRKLDDETNEQYQRRQRDWGGRTERVIAGIINSGGLENIARLGRQQLAHLEPEDQDLGIKLIQKEAVEREISNARSAFSRERRERIEAEQRGRLTGAPTG